MSHNNTGRRVGVRWLRLSETLPAAADSSSARRQSFIPSFLGFSASGSSAPAPACSRRPARCWRTCWSGRSHWVWCCFWCWFVRCARKRRTSSASTACSSTTCRDKPTVKHALHRRDTLQTRIQCFKNNPVVLFGTCRGVVVRESTLAGV